MGIRILIILLFVVNFTFSQTEEQRKYAIKNTKQFTALIKSSPSSKKLNSYYHSQNIYSDIYLDTPDFLLLKNNLSLRFRKRVFSSPEPYTSYTFQLKNEMDTLSSIRMEIEEPELDFYKIKTDGKWLKLIDLLDIIFAFYNEKESKTTKKEVNKAIKLIEKWIVFKAGGSIAPFQKISKLGKINVSNLKLVTCGFSTRKRSHIYATKEQSKNLNLGQNKVKRNDLPLYFLKNKNNVWLLESSLDEVISYAIFPCPINSIQFTEFEVENKYFIPKKGREIMDVYFKESLQKESITPQLKSKYQQMIFLFNKKN